MSGWLEVNGNPKARYSKDAQQKDHGIQKKKKNGEREIKRYAGRGA